MAYFPAILDLMLMAYSAQQNEQLEKIDDLIRNKTHLYVNLFGIIKFFPSFLINILTETTWKSSIVEL